MIIIGLTGENGSGKGTFVDYLRKKGFQALSLSDVLREELAAEGKEITRENLMAKGNELRKRFGPAILAKRTLPKVRGDSDCVIDSIRNPAEVEELRKLKGFLLVRMVAKSEVRFERVKKRARESDPQTLEAFKKVGAAEAAHPDATRQQLVATAKLADRIMRNDDGLQDLHGKIDALLAELEGGRA
jgi:dephospho-CoA kinase